MPKFVDSVTIEVFSGNGGDGIVHFRREKYVPKGGPDGGDGGDGGSIILKGSNSLQTLLDFRFHHVFKAEKGCDGSGGRRSGKRGENLYIHVPTGTIVKDEATGIIIGELLEDGQELLVAKGGRGGWGNHHFATPTNQAPMKAVKGTKGVYRKLRLDLKLIAKVGIVGLPNAGKSTLLSRISKAKPKIASYPFTTLSPNLGIVKIDQFNSFVITDIPGIIEGAHTGKGLGLRFLRHIERTEILLILVDLTSNDLEKDLRIILKELELYNPVMVNKERILVFNKCDAVSDRTLPEDVLKSMGFNQWFTISAITGEGIKELIGALSKKINETQYN